MANYSRELKMGADIRKQEKVEKAMELAERMNKVQEEVRAVLRKTQEKIKWQINRGRKKAKAWKREDKVILSTKDLVFKE